MPPERTLIREGSVTTRYVWTRDDWRLMMPLIAAIVAQRPDLMWFNVGFAVFGRSRLTNFLGLTLPLLTRRLGLPTVVTLHELFEAVEPSAIGAINSPITALGARLATRLVLKSDAVVVTLRRYQRQLQLLYQANNVQYVPHGMYTTPEALSIPSDAPPYDILMFTTFAPHRGLPVLLQAFEQVRENFPQATLTIAGCDHPRFPGYLAAQRQAAQHLTNVNWLGPQTEAQLRELFARARVVVLPYTATTGASSVLHRAVACGRPVVASDLIDLRSVAEEENLRLDFVPPGEPVALGHALSRVLGDAAYTQRIARQNLAVAQTMSLDHTVNCYADLFDQLVARRRRTIAQPPLTARRPAEES